ncbi:MAG: YebC/PmpR family DNA-binding transcriptional regulator [Acholeplasmataceae bacterium]|nr:YebC/PmpR family DNA-binding transcriptional regulator [Acholeplasmataceae bacterium]
MGRAHEVRKVAMAKTAAKKSKLYAKYGKEIYMAAKSGLPDPDTNLNLKRIIDRARKDQVPSDVIDRAIEKSKGTSDESYALARYEFFGPGGSQFIVECLTDNPNRTVSDVRACFTKIGGKVGSVLHMFEHRSMFSFEGLNEEQVLEALIEGGADIVDMEEEDGFVTIYGEQQSYNDIRTALLDKFPDLDLQVDEIVWLPLSYIELTDGHEIEQFQRLMGLLEDVEDVQNIYHNISNQDE